jgi:hypothetical protein
MFFFLIFPVKFLPIAIEGIGERVCHNKKSRSMKMKRDPFLIS